MDLSQRKGAVRRAEVPQMVRDGLDDGTLESVNLVEWLCVDQQRLLRAVLPQLGLERYLSALAATAAELADSGIMARLSGLGEAMGRALRQHGQADALAALRTHRSDTVRAWAAYAELSEPGLSLADYLARCRPYAVSPNMGVREVAWMVFRPHLMADLTPALALLEPWVADPDPNARRFASEGSRPRGVWCRHIGVLKDDPTPGLALLAPLKNDPARYVQTSVANWLNDASKTRPDLVEARCLDWLERSPRPATRWICHHGTRTLRKAGSLSMALQQALSALSKQPSTTG